MAVLSHGQIADLWVRAGGNPQYADKAASAAIQKSGGKTDAPGGLWGLGGASAGLDPMNDARSAISQYADLGFDFGGWFGEATGIANLGRAMYYAILVPGGLGLMLLGFVLMIFGSKPVKTVARFVGEQAVAGFGFGIGAAAVTPRGRRPPPFPPEVTGTVGRAATVPPAPSTAASLDFPPAALPAGRQPGRQVITGDWTEEIGIAQGGPVRPARWPRLGERVGRQTGYTGRHRGE